MLPKVKLLPAPGRIYATIRNRVHQVFFQRGFIPHANIHMRNMTEFFLTSFIILYIVMLSWTAAGCMALLLAAALRIFSAFVGFHVRPAALSGSRPVSNLFGFCFNLGGDHPYVWSITHAIALFTDTNIAGHDEDIEVAPWLIQTKEVDQLNATQHFQHSYAFFTFPIEPTDAAYRSFK